jgi:peptide/nickel transport system permease protein
MSENTALMITRPRVGLSLPLGVALALAWLAAMVAVALLADVIRPYPITAIDLGARLQPPFGFGGGARHLLGTDELGRDVLSRLIVSIRLSLLIAFGATVFGITLGAFLGIAAAHLRGLGEQAILMLVDVQAALPFMILALSVLAFFGNSLGLLTGLLGLYGWERHARVARGLALGAGAQGYTLAVRQLGAGPWRLYVRHVLPNIAATLIVSATLAFPEIILLESGLSFLGLGVQPPMSSLGNMVGYGRGYLSNAPWIVLTPSAVIAMTTLAISMTGDWLRDRLDPTVN